MNHSAVRAFSDIDPRLLTEAFRRAREHADNAEIDSDALFSAILDEARRGARDIYSLVKAAGSAPRPDVEKRGRRAA